MPAGLMLAYLFECKSAPLTLSVCVYRSVHWGYYWRRGLQPEQSQPVDSQHSRTRSHSVSQTGETLQVHWYELFHLSSSCMQISNRLYILWYIYRALCHVFTRPKVLLLIGYIMYQFQSTVLWCRKAVQVFTQPTLVTGTLPLMVKLVLYSCFVLSVTLAHWSSNLIDIFLNKV